MCIYNIIGDCNNYKINYFFYLVPSRRKRKISDFVEKLNDELSIKEPVNDFHKLPSQKYIISSKLLIIYNFQ